MHRGNNIGKSYESQQGYHPARQIRRDTGGGQQHWQLNHANGQCAAPAGDSTFVLQVKEEQCLHLAECAKNYNLYDLFVFFFGDDIDFDTGSIDKDEKISLSRDLYDIHAKVRRTALQHMMCLPLMQQLCSHSNPYYLFVLLCRLRESNLWPLQSWLGLFVKFVSSWKEQVSCTRERCKCLTKMVKMWH